MEIFLEYKTVCKAYFLRILDRYYRVPISERGLQSKPPSEAGERMMGPNRLSRSKKNQP